MAQAVPLMVEDLGSIVEHGHDVRVIVFVVVVERVEYHRQTVPPVRRPEDFSGVVSTLGCVPKCLEMI